MSDIAKEKVEHIARLARISLSEEQVDRFGRQLSSIIDYNMRLLSEVDVEGVEPTSQTTGLENRFDEDEVRDSFSQDEAIAEAPHREEGQFKVRKVLASS